MNMPITIEDVFGAPSRLAVLRVLAAGKEVKATGRELAKRTGFSAPATHDTLKFLLEQGVLKREIYGRLHVYSLNEDSRIVQKFIRPLFSTEADVCAEVGTFIVQRLKDAGMLKEITSLILYGSVLKGTAHSGSDIDVAVVVGRSASIERVDGFFHAELAERFKAYFGAQLDAYTKSAEEFRSRLKKNRPPLSTLMKSYAVLYGKEPLEV